MVALGGILGLKSTKYSSKIHEEDNSTAINSNNNSGNTTIININSGNTVDSGNTVNSGNVAKNKNTGLNIGNMLAGVIGIASSLVSGILGGGQSSYLDQGQNGLLDFIC